MFHVPMLPRSFEAVCRDLAHPSVRVRLSALRETSRHADGAGRAQLLALMLAALDENSKLRVPVLVALADAGMVEAVPKIIPLLREGDVETRRFALLALGELAPSGDVELASKIAPFLSAADPRVRYQAIAATAAIAAPNAFDCVEAAAEDTDPWIRELAVRLLEEGLTPFRETQSAVAATDRAHALLMKLARDPVEKVRAVAQLACHERGLEAPKDGVVALIVPSRRGREPRDEQVAIELAGRHRWPEAMRGLEKRAFGRFGFASDPFRYHARAALAVLGHAAARRAVERGLARGSRIERAALALALGQMGASEFVLAIEQVGLDPELRETAEQALDAMRRVDS